MNRDGLFTEETELKRQLKEISPKLSLHKKISDRLAEVQRLITISRDGKQN